MLACRKCGGEMRLGQALAQTYGGVPDFIGGEVVTVSPGGPGRLIDCLKCAKCGWSVTFDPKLGAAAQYRRGEDWGMAEEAAAPVLTDEQRRARDKILDFIYEYGTASEGIERLFDEYDACVKALEKQIRG